MSKFHGEQYWTAMRQRTMQNWRDLSEDDFDAMRALRHDREVRDRSYRDRLGRGARIDPKELDL